MIFADDDELGEAITGATRLSQMTGDSIARALDNFALPLQPDRNLEWLAMAVRRSLAIAIPDLNNGPDRTSNREVRSEVERLAGIVGSAWQELFLIKDAAESHIWDYGWKQWDGKGGTDIGHGMMMGEPSEYRRFKAAVAELDWLAGFLRQAAQATKSQSGPWRQSEAKRVRVERAQYLAPIFEAAFGQKVSANNFPNDVRHKAPTAFMDFYQRMVTLAFGVQETVNLAEVAKAACQLHREHPAQFGEGIIPGL